MQRCREIKDLVAQMAVLNPEMNGFLRNCDELNLWKLLLTKTRKGQLEFGNCKDLYGLFRIQHYPFFDGKANVLLDQNLACCIAVLQMSGCLETLSPPNIRDIQLQQILQLILSVVKCNGLVILCRLFANVSLIFC